MSDTDTIRITEAAPDQAIPMLWEGPALDLPDNAIQNGDGSVMVTLRYPFDLQFRQGAEVIRSERITEVVLHRLTGADVLKITKAKSPDRAAIIASARLSPAKFELWSDKMDATDESAIGAIVAELMGAGRTGLPEEADDQGDAVILALRFPTADDTGTVWDALRFPRMTASQRRGMREADDSLVWAVRHATSLTPKSAKALVNAMDAADAAGVMRVIGFLT